MHKCYSEFFQGHFPFSLDLWNELCSLIIYWHDIKFTFLYSFDLLIVYKNRVVTVLAKRNCIAWYIWNMVNKGDSILKHFHNQHFYFLYFRYCYFNRLKLCISQGHGRKHNSPDGSKRETGISYRDVRGVREQQGWPGPRDKQQWEVVTLWSWREENSVSSAQWSLKLWRKVYPFELWSDAATVRDTMLKQAVSGK